MSSDIEKKLLEYRAKKKREEYVNSLKQKTRDFFHNLAPRKPLLVSKVWFMFSLLDIYIRFQPSVENKLTEELEEQEEEEIEETHDLLCADGIAELDSIDEKPLLQCSFLDYIYYLLCFILWVTVYAIFIKLQFGTVYLLLSGLIGMYANTRTRPKRRNEISAYSVFNKNCESIPGTLKAEQFEKEMRYGAAAVH